MSLDMYAEEILDHYRNPKNFGRLENSDMSSKDLNPVCGDQYEFQVKVSDGKVTEIKFNGDGCAISMASASMLSDFVKGKNVLEIQKITPEMVLGLLKVELSPSRMECALLPLSILKNLKKSDV